ncbi:ECF-type sigma factor [Phenylobacterium sp.]|uniref:ECF-type sigma factor n=1 Tax=Phenylobacterium sp. TaxID=1871053 RepID=UPI00286D2D3A|nr:ECF-type sigma factor [Phenylobacterium sp.]
MRDGDLNEEARKLLQSWREGDLAARDRLFELFYPDLRRSAAAMLRRERGVSLSTGDLIHEAVARLVGLDRIAWNDRAHFMALSSMMMRRALLDYVRAKRALKREHRKVELVTGIPDTPDVEIEALNAALDELAIIDPERAQIVEMRYFGGMGLGDIGVVLGLSESTVKRRWNGARLWLLEALKP